MPGALEIPHRRAPEVVEAGARAARPPCRPSSRPVERLEIAEAMVFFLAASNFVTGRLWQSMGAESGMIWPPSTEHPQNQ